MQIPIIDFHPFIVGDTVAKEAVADQISRAIHEIGCFYIKNCGLPNNLISQVFAQIKWFFALSPEEKNQIPMVADGTSRGYIAQWKEELLNESFIFSKEIFIDEAGESSYAFDAPNQWLKSQPEFREVLWQSYIACHDMTTKVLQAFAIALKLPESYFTDLHSEQNHNALLHHYPSLVQPPKPGQTRFDEHRYFDNDCHWNIAGHKLAAQLILDTLKQEKGLDLTTDITARTSVNQFPYIATHQVQ